MVCHALYDRSRGGAVQPALSSSRTIGPQEKEAKTLFAETTPGKKVYRRDFSEDEAFPEGSALARKDRHLDPWVQKEKRPPPEECDEQRRQTGCVVPSACPARSLLASRREYDQYQEQISSILESIGRNPRSRDARAVAAIQQLRLARKIPFGELGQDAIGATKNLVLAIHGVPSSPKTDSISSLWEVPPPPVSNDPNRKTMNDREGRVRSTRSSTKERAALRPLLSRALRTQLRDSIASEISCVTVRSSPDETDARIALEEVVSVLTASERKGSALNGTRTPSDASAGKPRENGTRVVSQSVAATPVPGTPAGSEKGGNFSFLSPALLRLLQKIRPSSLQNQFGSTEPSSRGTRKGTVPRTKSRWSDTGTTRSSRTQEPLQMEDLVQLIDERLAKVAAGRASQEMHPPPGNPKKDAQDTGIAKTSDAPVGAIAPQHSELSPGDGFAPRTQKLDDPRPPEDPEERGPGGGPECNAIPGLERPKAIGSGSHNVCGGPPGDPGPPEDPHPTDSGSDSALSEFEPRSSDHSQGEPPAIPEGPALFADHRSAAVPPKTTSRSRRNQPRTCATLACPQVSAKPSKEQNTLAQSASASVFQSEGHVSVLQSEGQTQLGNRALIGSTDKERIRFLEAELLRAGGRPRNKGTPVQQSAPKGTRSKPVAQLALTDSGPSPLPESGKRERPKTAPRKQAPSHSNTSPPSGPRADRGVAPRKLTATYLPPSIRAEEAAARPRGPKGQSHLPRAAQGLGPGQGFEPHPSPPLQVGGSAHPLPDSEGETPDGLEATSEEEVGEDIDGPESDEGSDYEAAEYEDAISQQDAMSYRGWGRTNGIEPPFEGRVRPSRLNPSLQGNRSRESAGKTISDDDPTRTLQEKQLEMSIAIQKLQETLSGPLPAPQFGAPERGPAGFRRHLLAVRRAYLVGEDGGGTAQMRGENIDGDDAISFRPERPLLTRSAVTQGILKCQDETRRDGLLTHWNTVTRFCDEKKIGPVKEAQTIDSTAESPPGVDQGLPMVTPYPLTIEGRFGQYLLSRVQGAGCATLDQLVGGDRSSFAPLELTPPPLLDTPDMSQEALLASQERRFGYYGATDFAQNAFQHLALPLVPGSKLKDLPPVSGVVKAAFLAATTTNQPAYLLKIINFEAEISKRCRMSYPSLLREIMVQRVIPFEKDYKNLVTRQYVWALKQRAIEHKLINVFYPKERILNVTVNNPVFNHIIYHVYDATGFHALIKKFKDVLESGELRLFDIRVNDFIELFFFEAELPLQFGEKEFYAKRQALTADPGAPRVRHRTAVPRPTRSQAAGPAAPARGARNPGGVDPSVYQGIPPSQEMGDRGKRKKKRSKTHPECPLAVAHASSAEVNAETQRPPRGPPAPHHCGERHSHLDHRLYDVMAAVATAASLTAPRVGPCPHCPYRHLVVMIGHRGKDGVKHDLHLCPNYFSRLRPRGTGSDISCLVWAGANQPSRLFRELLISMCRDGEVANSRLTKETDKLWAHAGEIGFTQTLKDTKASGLALLARPVGERISHDGQNPRLIDLIAQSGADQAEGDAPSGFKGRGKGRGKRGPPMKGNAPRGSPDSFREREPRDPNAQGKGKKGKGKRERQGPRPNPFSRAVLGDRGVRGPDGNVIDFGNRGLSHHRSYSDPEGTEGDFVRIDGDGSIDGTAFRGAFMVGPRPQLFRTGQTGRLRTLRRIAGDCFDQLPPVLPSCAPGPIWKQGSPGPPFLEDTDPCSIEHNFCPRLAHNTWDSRPDFCEQCPTKGLPQQFPMRCRPTRCPTRRRDWTKFGRPIGSWRQHGPSFAADQERISELSPPSEESDRRGVTVYPDIQETTQDEERDDTETEFAEEESEDFLEPSLRRRYLSNCGGGRLSIYLRHRGKRPQQDVFAYPHPIGFVGSVPWISEHGVTEIRKGLAGPASQKEPELVTPIYIPRAKLEMECGESVTRGYRVHHYADLEGWTRDEPSFPEALTEPPPDGAASPAPSIVGEVGEDGPTLNVSDPHSSRTIGPQSARTIGPQEGRSGICTPFPSGPLTEGSQVPRSPRKEFGPLPVTPSGSRVPRSERSTPRTLSGKDSLSPNGLRSPYAKRSRQGTTPLHKKGARPRAVPLEGTPLMIPALGKEPGSLMSLPQCSSRESSDGEWKGTFNEEDSPPPYYKTDRAQKSRSRGSAFSPDHFRQAEVDQDATLERIPDTLGNRWAPPHRKLRTLTSSLMELTASIATPGTL
ncbi:MAG: hypothetical protein CME32_23015, partial [Gimesia sp.]|nr:hypothetical protein [Gimesia sp.]